MGSNNNDKFQKDELPIDNTTIFGNSTLWAPMDDPLDLDTVSLLNICVLRMVCFVRCVLKVYSGHAAAKQSGNACSLNPVSSHTKAQERNRLNSSAWCFSRRSTHRKRGGRMGQVLTLQWRKLLGTRPSLR